MRILCYGKSRLGSKGESCLTKMGRLSLKNGLFLLTTRSSMNSIHNLIVSLSPFSPTRHTTPFGSTTERPVVPHLFKIQPDFLDARIPGRRKQPDSAWRPKYRPHLPLPNPYAALIPTQTNGDPFPTLILEVGNSQSIPDLLQIRDKALSWKTGINVFVLIAYNRNSTRATDSWFMQVSHRDFTAPLPPPMTPDTYPPCIVMFETTKTGNRYPLVNTPIPPGRQVWAIHTTHLYFPPVLNPAIPAAFNINIEMIRQTIASER